MEVTINGNAEMIVKKLVELGRFPSADCAVNEVILRIFSDQVLAQSNLLGTPIAFDEQLQVSEFPYRTCHPVTTISIAGKRLPDPVVFE